jgi:ATPases involved in chromosome partitioning
MTKVIAIANQKGGVGKTSTTVNLGAGLVRQGYDVLLIDLDSQANLTMALGYQNPDDMEYTVSNVLHKAVKEEQVDPAEGILTTAEGIDLMPANVQLSGLELSLINEYGREVVLKQYIDEVRLNYDFILIDCAPSLSVLTVNALVAADSVLIPTQPQYFSMAGIQMFYDTFSKIRKKMNPSLSIEGVLVTMMDNRPNFTKELVTQLRNAYGDVFRVFQTEIPTSIRISESNARGKSIFEFDRKGKVAAAYEKLTQEVIENGRQKQTVQRELRTVQTAR